jgi:hypothetical protein
MRNPVSNFKLPIHLLTIPVAPALSAWSPRSLHAALKCFQAGSAQDKKNRLGHARIETTMKHYTHKVDADDRKAADAIGAMLSPTVELVN